MFSRFPSATYNTEDLPSLSVSADETIAKYINNRKMGVDGEDEILGRAKQLMTYRARITSHNFTQLKLRDHLQKMSFPDDEPIRIVSIGCGDAHDFIALFELFNMMGRSFEYHGFDNNHERLLRAQTGFKTFSHVCFHEGDITKTYRHYPAHSFDIVILKQLNIADENFICALAKNVIPHLLTNEGLTYTSFLLSHEHEQFLSFIQNRFFPKKTEEALREFLIREEVDNSTSRYGDKMPTLSGKMLARKPEAHAFLCNVEPFVNIAKQTPRISHCNRLLLLSGFAFATAAAVANYYFENSSNNNVMPSL